MTFNPHPTYEGLLKQARSMYSLSRLKDRTCSHLLERIQQLQRELSLRSDSEIDALRETNRKLTELVERALPGEHTP